MRPAKIHYRRSTAGGDVMERYCRKPGSGDRWQGMTWNVGAVTCKRCLHKMEGGRRRLALDPAQCACPRCHDTGIAGPNYCTCDAGYARDQHDEMEKEDK